MKKKIIILGILFTSILTLGGGYFARRVIPELKQEENLELAIYVDDEKQSTIPGKDSGYTLDLEKSSCTYGNISWDSDSWSPVVTVNNEVNGKVRCNLYFRETTPYDECIVKYGSDSTQCNILADFDEEVCPTVDENGNVLVSSAESENGYLCSAPDDYGTSYYYRGNVTNNYVKFAGYYWRIIRINGDGSIRMIYDGTTAHANGESNTDRQIGTSEYNSEGDRENAYVGYMYGNTSGTTYEATHRNTNSSTIKEYLDNWYTDVFLNQEYEAYLNDTLFCNDRSLRSGTGIGGDMTGYRATSNQITLNCIQQNDRFTVNDKVTGNGALTYPIGLITVDEAYLAGGYSTANTNYYLYSGNESWLTMTPYLFDGRYALVYNINASIKPIMDISVMFSFGVRPVINLKPNSLKSGDGTASNPYQV